MGVCLILDGGDRVRSGGSCFSGSPSDGCLSERVLWFLVKFERIFWVAVTP